MNGAGDSREETATETVGVEGEGVQGVGGGGIGGGPLERREGRFGAEKLVGKILLLGGVEKASPGREEGDDDEEIDTIEVGESRRAWLSSCCATF